MRAILLCFPRAKACIALVNRTRVQSFETLDPVVLVALAVPKFAFGATHLVHLSQALLHFGNLGGSHVQKALSHSKGIHVVCLGKASGTAQTLQDANMNRCQITGTRLSYKPKHFNVAGNSWQSDYDTAHLLLDLVDWVKWEKDSTEESERSLIDVLMFSVESAEVCATAVSLRWCCATRNLSRTDV